MTDPTAPSGDAEVASGDRLLRAIRRIVRQVSEHSRHLHAEVGLTVPQLLCLRAIMRAWRPDADDLPGAPTHPLRVAEARDRPNPQMDLNAGDGMAVAVGRLEACPVMGLKFFALSHNTVRGAAGASLLNASLLRRRGLI